jgi:ribosomal protein S18 acetylase RimI-like enzyme
MRLRLKAFFATITFFATNLLGFIFGPAIKDTLVGDYRVVSFNRRHYSAVLSLWRSCTIPTCSHRILLKLFGKKMCFVLIDHAGAVIGFLMLHYRAEELKQRRIHVALIAVRPESHGKGLGSALATTAFELYRNSCWIRGVSARYDVGNESSRRIFMKYGFQVSKNYFDETSQVNREYVVYSYIRPVLKSRLLYPG